MDSEALSAVKKGDLKKLKERLDRGININAQDAKGRTLLHYAASNCQPKIVQYLLQNGADILLTTHKNNTALHISASKDSGLTTSASILVNVDRGKLRNLLDVKTKSAGNTALHIATKFTKHQSLLLLYFGAIFDMKNNAGEKPADLANTAGNRLLYQLIGANFEMAATGRRKLLANLLKFKQTVFSAMLNCRNNNGSTLVQVLLLEVHVDLAREISRMRFMQPMSKAQRFLLEPKYGREIDKLYEQAKLCKEFWIKHRNQNMSDSDVKELSEGVHVGKIIAEMLRKTKDLLFVYWYFEDTHKPLFDDNMKTIEDAFVLLGFDSRTLICYLNSEYNCSNNQARKDRILFVDDVKHTIYTSINYFARNLNAAQMFHAVKDNKLGRVKQLLESGAPTSDVDHTGRTVLCHAAENGNRKIVELLLESGEKILQEGTLSPIYLSAREDHTDIVKLLLEKSDPKLLAEFIDWQPKTDDLNNGICKSYMCTALHVATKRGRFSIVKMLMKYGANYTVLDEEKRTPLQVPTSMEVGVFLMLVDDCFQKAKEANFEIVSVLESMQINDFLAATGTKNHDGQTLAVVAAKAGAKNISKTILKMIKKAKHK